MPRLSPHFDSSEFACPHCKKHIVDPRLVAALEDLRMIAGPLTINSGYRCEAHNKAIGGEKNSKHTQGIAVDVACPKHVSLRAFYDLARSIPAFDDGGIGVYPAGRGQNSNFLHLDVRLGAARWARVDGKYVGVEKGFVT